MKDDLQTSAMHPQFVSLLRQYARDLAQIAPSTELDARIGLLVAARRPNVETARRVPRRMQVYAAAAGFAGLAVGVGIFIGMRLKPNESVARDTVWPAADLTMWPTDSVSFKIPAEYSAQGTLVAVDPNSKNTSTRYWIDVVVSNDGTFRIERIVPADPNHTRNGHDGTFHTP
ncbi:MAG: hypothetical protein ABI769_13185 [Pseudomonadota bacterium]